jgi:UDP-N-acetylmuramate: L-alanyl-gamma-D-glutamyl-meso-diaminopimelate ligase
MNNPKHIHIIGICGVATSALPLLFIKKGWKVTGSDKGFYPPVSTHLTEAGILFYAGWHPENIGTPDLHRRGCRRNRSFQSRDYVCKRKGFRFFLLPKRLGKYFVKKNSIVVTGTWGKRPFQPCFHTSFSRQAWIRATLQALFPFHTKRVHFRFRMERRRRRRVPGRNLGQEGQIFLLRRHIFLLTSVSWDHADLYPTENPTLMLLEKLLPKFPIAVSLSPVQTKKES